MRRQTILLALLLSLLLHGCGLAIQATRVVSLRTNQVLDDLHEQKRNRKWAEDAWGQVAPRMPFPVGPDYGEGFKDGFAEYLYHGASVSAPTTAPSRYHDLRYQSAEGYHAIQQWYAGYQHGTAAAEQGGFRRLVTGPPPPDYLPPEISIPPVSTTPPGSSWEGRP